jgi:hypothetical protein
VEPKVKVGQNIRANRKRCKDADTERMEQIVEQTGGRRLTYA